MRGRRSHPTQLSTLELKRPSRHLVTPRQPRLRCSRSKQCPVTAVLSWPLPSDISLEACVLQLAGCARKPGGGLTMSVSRPRI